MGEKRAFAIIGGLELKVTGVDIKGVEGLFVKDDVQQKLSKWDLNPIFFLCAKKHNRAELK